MNIKEALDNFIEPYAKQYREEILEEKIINRLKSEEIRNALPAFFDSAEKSVLHTLQEKKYSCSVEVPATIRSSYRLMGLEDEFIILPNKEKIQNKLSTMIADFYENYLYLSIDYNTNSGTADFKWSFRESKFSHLVPKDHKAI